MKESLRRIEGLVDEGREGWTNGEQALSMHFGQKGGL